MNTYTVFAVYDDEHHDPYATTVEAPNPSAAVDAAQAQADWDNEGFAVKLIGCQVIDGDHRVIF